LPQHPQQLPVSQLDHGGERFGSPARIRISPATQTAPFRNVISSATPDALSRLEGCGVADKTAISGRCPAPGAAPIEAALHFMALHAPPDFCSGSS